MRKTDINAFTEALIRLRELQLALNETDAGVCLIHLDACIAALESRIRRAGAAPEAAAHSTDHDVARPLHDARRSRTRH